MEELALAYVARFATTAKGLQKYCRRKLRERGWEDAEEGAAAPDIDALVERFVRNGYVNDAEFARAKSGSLLRRGYGERRVGQALTAAGVAEEDRAHIAEGEARHAALRLAEKRRFGPFGADGAPPDDRALREKQVAAMLRAGHRMDAARELVHAPDADAAREWATALDDKEDDA
ncbi:regulatory protein RecX [Croceicoccus naphthovorans]|uniref:regulatory protein RecX n=1 Tax=Croceicoccus naphthovorans TaxID=1348774 RepID=UPI001FE19335|nr:regulatory protein RecX [Croceicoccus naphthovorans]